MQGGFAFIHLIANNITFEYGVIKERVENGMRWLGSASLSQNSTTDIGGSFFVGPCVSSLLNELVRLRRTSLFRSRALSG
jgi:hypothetical protein